MVCCRFAIVTLYTAQLLADAYRFGDEYTGNTLLPCETFSPEICKAAPLCSRTHCQAIGLPMTLPDYLCGITPLPNHQIGLAYDTA